jgi:hypothetical protein
LLSRREDTFFAIFPGLFQAHFLFEAFWPGSQFSVECVGFSACSICLANMIWAGYWFWSTHHSEAMRANKYFLSYGDEDGLAFLVPYTCCITFLCRQISGISFWQCRKYERNQIVIPQIQLLSKSLWSLREADVAAN